MADLTLSDLGSGTPGITPALGEALAEAACVCLDDQDHENKTPFRVGGAFDEVFELVWETPTDQTKRSWNDPEVSTEYGAYGLATLLVLSLTHLTVVERSRKGTGFDYWLGDEQESGTLFQRLARLEVSGIRRGSHAKIRARVEAKVEQTKQSDEEHPALTAYVIVVEFGRPCSQVVKRNG